MTSKKRFAGVATGTTMGLLLAACVPIFTGGLFQTLGLSFRFDGALPQGTETAVLTTVFPESVKLKKNFVRVSGGLGGGGRLPDAVTLEATFTDATGKTSQRLSLRLGIGGNGSFSGVSRVKKNIGAGETMTVTLEPRGADLPAGAEIQLCVDVVKKRADLAALPDCIAATDDGNDDDSDGAEALSSLQQDFLTPTCATFGCHSTASATGGLVLVAGAAHGNLVGVASSQQPSLDRVAPNDPEASYLIKKLRGDGDITGTQMPRGGPFLTDEQIGRFISWINSGAPNN